MAGELSVDAVMAEVQGRVRERLRERLLLNGASKAFEDPELYTEVERLLLTATDLGDAQALILPELLGEPAQWRLETAMSYQSHRGTSGASLVLFVKQRLLMPLVRWLFEYSRDNFERQRRVNRVLFACVQELAVETAQLRKEVRRLSNSQAHSASPGQAHSTSSGQALSGVEAPASSGRREAL